MQTVFVFLAVEIGKLMLLEIINNFELDKGSEYQAVSKFANMIRWYKMTYKCGCQKRVDVLIRWSVAHIQFWMTKLMEFWVDLPQSPRKSHKCNQGYHWQQHQHGHQSNHRKVQNLRQQRQPPPLPGRCHAGSLHFLQSLILKRWNCGSWKWLPKKNWPKKDGTSRFLTWSQANHSPLTMPSRQQGIDLCGETQV